MLIHTKLLENGNRYEGYWLYDKKEGPGKYFYHDTQKVYEGEWHDDIAKCGIFHDMSEVISLENNFELPQIGLLHPDSVVLDAINRIRHERTIHFTTKQNTSKSCSSGAAAAGSSSSSLLEDFEEPKLSIKDCQLLGKAFQNSDIDGRGFIRCADLIHVLSRAFPEETFPEEQVSDLLAQLNATYDTEITLIELQELVVLLF